MDSSGGTSTINLSNEAGTLKATVLTYGAIVSHLFTKDSTGQLRDVVLGFDSPDQYKEKGNSPYFGCAVGRVAGRIHDGKFTLNGKQVKLECNTNEGKTHLHGGKIGFSKREWKILSTSKSSVSLKLVSVNGDQGYPGSLTTIVTYTLTDSNELIMEYNSELDPLAQESTIVNLTNHSYFNLSGLQCEEDRLITDHLMVTTDDVIGFLETDDALVSTGKTFLLNSPEADGLDFSEKPGGKIYSIGDRHDAIGGYDHSYMLNNNPFHKDCFKVWSNKSGIIMTVSTNEPSVQFYSGQCIPVEYKSKKTQANGSLQLGPHSGFCLEAQRFPNAINVPEWQSQVILNPGKKYEQRTIYKFDVINSD